MFKIITTSKIKYNKSEHQTSVQTCIRNRLWSRESRFCHCIDNIKLVGYCVVGKGGGYVKGLFWIANGVTNSSTRTVRLWWVSVSVSTPLILGTASPSRPVLGGCWPLLGRDIFMSSPQRGEDQLATTWEQNIMDGVKTPKLDNFVTSWTNEIKLFDMMHFM